MRFPCVGAESETEASYEWTGERTNLAMYGGIDLTLCRQKRASGDTGQQQRAELLFSARVRAVGWLLASERVFELFFFHPASSVWYRDVRAPFGRSFWEIFSLSERVTFCPAGLRLIWELAAASPQKLGALEVLLPSQPVLRQRATQLLPPPSSHSSHLSSVDNVCKQR